MGRIRKRQESPGLTKLPSGSTLLDLMLGGGYPLGRVVNLVGDKSSGKTLLALEMLFRARQKYGDKLKWFYDDCEAGLTFNTSSLYGFEVRPDDQKDSQILEEFEINLNKQLSLLKENEILIYIIDSLDGLESLEGRKYREKKLRAIEKNTKIDGSYGMGKARELSEFFRNTAQDIRDKNCLLLVISQVRENIGVMFGQKYRRTGGKALDMYSSQIIWLSESEKLGSKDRPYGICIKARTEKNKTGRPFRSCFVDILFDYGLDDLRTNINYLYDLKTPEGKTKKDRWDKGIKDLNWKGSFEGHYDEEGLLSLIEDQGLEEEIQSMVEQKWRDSEVVLHRKSKF